MRKRKAGKTAAALLCAAQLAFSSLLTIPLQAIEPESETILSDDGGSQINAPAAATYINHFEGSERRENFDANWSFQLGDAYGAQQLSYNDSSWEVVNLPHDYSISQDYSATNEAESGYLPGGTAWYRKVFTLGSNVAGRRVMIDFDGVYNNATVYINGHKLGSHPYGYSPFAFDLSDYLNFEGENVLAVKVEHQTPSSRWYSGSGIYRSVHLTITDPVHVDWNGTYMTSPDLESQKDGDVDTNIETTLVNDSNASKTVSIRQSLRKKGSDTVVSSDQKDNIALPAQQSMTISQTLKVNKPDLWDTEDPNLYTMRTEVIENGTVIDTYDTQYGFRYFHFDADTGFWLNGRAMKLNGVCMHHDQGALGAIDTKRAIERQVEILKEMGCNSIRTSHNPASSHLVEICDEQGILLMEEFFDGWSTIKNGNVHDYSSHFKEAIAADNEILHTQDGDVWSDYDLREVMRRDRSAPSLFIWDIGNEIEYGDTSEFPEIADRLIEDIRQMDAYRPMILGDNQSLNTSLYATPRIREKIVAAGGLVGANYALAKDLGALYRQAHPDWKFLGTENASAVNSRGIYNRIANCSDVFGDRQLTSYDYSCVGWGSKASTSLLGFVENDWYAGEYVWTGFDYLGEPTPWNGTDPGAVGGWPAPKSSYFGIIDTAGFPKDSYYFYRSIWKQDDTTLHILPAWKSNVVYKDNNGKTPVVVYTNAHAVKLEYTDVNGNVTDLGTKTFTEHTTANGYTYRKYEGADKDSIDDRNLYLTWQVPYADGTITATAYDKDGHVIEKTIGRNSVSTYGEAYALRAKADRSIIQADGKDLLYVSVDVLDENGREVVDAANRVSFSVEGEGRLIALDNGNAIDHQSYRDRNRQAFSGKVLAIVESSGNPGGITITASADGLQSSTVQVRSESPAQESGRRALSLTYSNSAYIKAGSTPSLPYDALLNYSDGTNETLPITWEDIDFDTLEETGSVLVHGKAGLHPVSFRISVMDEIAAAANYSTAIPKGASLSLPDRLPALRRDGSKLDISFPVTWQNTEAVDPSSPGTYVIGGMVDLLGQSCPVSASIRVVQADESFGANEMVPRAYSITQDIPEDLQTGSPAAIKDGSRTYSVEESAEPSYWSTRKWAKAGHTQSTMTVALDTMALLGKMDLYFIEDSRLDAVYPDRQTLKIEVSQTGNEWTEIDYTETIGQADGNVKCYSYRMDPVQALLVRFTFSEAAGSGANVRSTAISEIEMYPVLRNFTTFSSTGVESITINGHEEVQEDPNAQILTSPAWKADTLVAKGQNNAAVTILSTDQEERYLLYVESEDHSTSRLVWLNLRTLPGRDPQSAAWDLPISGMHAEASSEVAGYDHEGPARLVLDGNAETWFHTDWVNHEGRDLEDRHIDLIFDEIQEISGLRYLPRYSSVNGGRNGQITTYKIQYKESDSGAWTDLSQGEWPYTTGWKSCEFNRSVKAKAVRLIGVETWTNSVKASTDMSVAELRIMRPSSQNSLEDLEHLNIVLPDSAVVTGSVDELDLSDQITVKNENTALTYNYDYYLSYSLDEEADELVITIHGCGLYSGSISRRIPISHADYDLSQLDLVISSANDIVEQADSSAWKTGDLTKLESALALARSQRRNPSSQQAVNEAALSLGQSLLEIRRRPDPENLPE